jgi:LmbE family N-acetylglucosaminyl deacetylase
MMNILQLFKKPEPPKRRGRPPKKPPTRWERFKTHFSSFKSSYVIISSAVLLLTTIRWSTLGALTQRSNADQIINTYLFHDFETFSMAAHPAAHTFLLKWPLFIIERLSGYSSFVLIILTILVSLVTVMGLAYILYRIDKRPRVIGTAFLALACILLFIPAQPHTGGLLPVNFAMLMTRNIEYLFYILSLVCIIRAPKLKSRQTYWAIAFLAILITSDKLFMWISLGAAVLTLAIYLIARRKPFVELAVRWLIITVVSFIIATVFLWVLNATGLTHAVGDNNPYGISLEIKQLVLGGIFAVMGLLTNFGANPAFDIGVVKDIPKVFAERLVSPIVLPFFINIGIFIGGLVATFVVFRKSFIPVKQRKRAKKKPEFSVATALSISLLFSSVVAVGLFVGTNHYYPVDARYETIVLFALCVSVMTYIRTQSLPKLRVNVIAPVLVLAIVIGSVWSFATYNQQSNALNEIDARNAKVAEVLQNYKTDLLVGDYWRVVPISQVDKKLINHILPLGGCTTPRASLKSTTWEKDFGKKSFVYLLTFDKSLTDYPSCSIEEVVQAYGRPNSSALIAGTSEKPQELLLFYDGGVNKNHAMTGLSNTATILPVSADEVKREAECADDVTVMNIVAHEDDDLLFMNPDIQREIDAKHCVRTVYVTAGDAGENNQYWLGRERASEVAYSSMLGADDSLVWIKRTVKLGENQFVSVASPRGHREVSLIYMHLPDGNLNGQGYQISGFESLSRLRNGTVAEVQTVDGQSRYSSSQLTDTLTGLMNFYVPTSINTQASTNVGHTYHDHVDHTTVGQYVEAGYEGYVNKTTTPLLYYVGYPVRERHENVFDTDLIRKTKTFLTYATFDGGVCQTQAMCDETPTYNAYLHRQYSY